MALYIAGPPKAAYQVNQWLRVLEELPLNVFILTRRKGIYDAMLPTQLPVVFARRAGDVEQVFDAATTLRIILYPANPMHNAQALRHIQYQHVFINHGESDKVVNQSKFLLAYDKLFLAGQLSLDRLRGAGLAIRDEQVAFVGRPQAELALNKIASPQLIQTVLYAPTWEGFVEEADYSSIGELGLNIIRTFSAQKRFKLIFKPHPYTGLRDKRRKDYLKTIRKLCLQHGVEYIESDVDIHTCMNQSDLLITDVSSVLNEYLVTSKPIMVCNPQGVDAPELHASYPSTRAAYVLNNGLDVVGLLNKVVQKDSLWPTRQAVREYSMGRTDDPAFDRFTVELQRLYSWSEETQPAQIAMATA